MRLLLPAFSLLLLVGCSSASTQPGTTRDSSPPTEASTVVPTSLHIESLGIHSTDEWVPLGIQGQNGVKVTPPGEKGQIEVPSIKKPMQLGWCSVGAGCKAAAPGDDGPAVVLGHINGGGAQGVFAKLAQIKKGALIKIGRSDGEEVTFKVTKVDTPKKAAFPTQAVYGPTDGPELRLITCGGGTNGLETINGQRSYVDQTIVYAVKQ